MEERKRLLSRLDLFEGLGDRELEEVVQIARRRKLASGELLFRRGDEGAEIYVVVTGRLKAYASGSDGVDRVFRHMGRGEVVGELAVFAECDRTASVKAVEECELLMIQRRELMPLLQRFPEIAVRLLRALSQRMVQNSEALEDANSQPVSVRLAKALIRFAERWGKPDGAGGTLIGARLSQGELGELVGASRESVNKTIGGWSEQGILSMRGGRVTIKALPALAAEAVGESADGADGVTASTPAKRSRAGTSAKRKRETARSVSRRRSSPA